MSQKAFLNHLGLACALGNTAESVRPGLFKGETGIVSHSPDGISTEIPLGVIGSAMPDMSDLPVELRGRNNALARIALASITEKAITIRDMFGPQRIGVVVGTSTSGILESEIALRHYQTSGSLPQGYHFAQQELGTLASFISYELQITGPSWVHSSACSSGAKAIAAAARLLSSGTVDAVITGAVDSLSSFTVAGFSALDLVSSSICQPYSVNRSGINLGEAAALFLMTRNEATVRLAGWGESSDGYHISSPDPSGTGAILAINKALSKSGLDAGAIDYINLHATGTRANDSCEGKVISSIFGDSTPCSGTKQLTGHTLGAAGALEAAFCWLTMQDENKEAKLPPHIWDHAQDPEIPPLNLVEERYSSTHIPRAVLSTSFAFGGSNAAIVLGRE